MFNEVLDSEIHQVRRNEACHSDAPHEVFDFVPNFHHASSEERVRGADEWGESNACPARRRLERASAIDGGKDRKDNEARQSAPVSGRNDGGEGAVGVHGDEEEEADE